MRVIHKNLCILVIIFLFFVCLSFPSISFSADYTETFDGLLTNTPLWDSTRGSVKYDVEGTRQYALFSTDLGPNSFQYYRTVNFNSIYPMYDSIRLGLKFISSSVSQGAGYIISDNVPASLENLQFDSYLFYIWPKPDGSFHLFTPLCEISNPLCSSWEQLSEGVFTFPNDNNWHEFRLNFTLSHYIVYFDSNVIFRTVNTQRKFSSIGIGDPEVTSGYLTWPNLYLDYLSIESLAVPSPSPILTPAPSATPSPAPTPTPTPVPSSFPYYSQSDTKWAKDIYDHAQSWAQRGRTGIDRWGCALSSTAMVLRNYGVKTKSGSETTPANLNSWLKSQPDGYLGNGLLNWLAVTRYAHESKMSGKSPTELEFVKNAYTQTNVEEQLNSGKYPILGIPGHFVTATSNNGSSFGIKDPASKSNVSLLKSEQILTSNTFSPSMTDLSYIFLAHDPDISVKVLDSRGLVISGIESEEYLTDDISGQESKHLKLLYLPKPKSGDYIVEVANDRDRKTKLDVYFYNKSGQVWTKKIEVYSETNTQFNFKYDNEKISKNKVAHNWKWVWRYIRKWRRWDRVWELKNRWHIED